MQFTISAAVLALIGSAFAQTANFDAITVPTKDQELVADGKQSYTITWDPTAKYDGKDVSILLLQGASQDSLDFYPGADVASSIDSALGEYTWTPDSSIAGYATYGLKLQLDSDTTIFQYSFPFKIKAGDDSSTAEVESSTTSSTTSVSAAKTASTSSSSSSSAAATVVSNNDDSVSTTTTPVSASATSATLAATDAGSATGSGAQTTLTTATKSSSTGSATSSSTSAVVTAGAGRVVAGGFAAVGGVVAAVLVL